MSVLQAITLGVIQGLTEFLPVSSSGHLIILPQVFGWESQPLVFDLVLHLGTALALVGYFFRDLINFKKLWPILLVGSIPAGIIGFLFGDFFEMYFRGTLTVAIFLILGSIFMFLAEKFAKSKDANLGYKKSLFIGLFQALALFPGMSRSGSTISGGMFLGLSREAAARFSFLLSVPIVIAASAFKVYESLSISSLTFDISLFAGFLSSFLIGLLAIKFLMNFVKKHSLFWFVGYRLLLALLLLTISL
ncbi:undecaprenyl-diphosphatase UppP [Patescibacteria group bacterium]